MAGLLARERRKVKRKSISLSVRVKVPLPEGGSATLVARANIVNISRSGVGVRIHSLKKEHAPLLVKEMRRCILSFDLPALKEPVVLQGDIVWTDVNVKDSLASAYLGVQLDPAVQEGILYLEQFLKSIGENSTA